jgi:meso-butanediol dehydrogenase/(S,S)-butanediol dehydrogenase/diacetyl reductase
MQRFEGRVAVITGAASGIGAATARRLHQEGATVVLADRRVAGGTALVEELGERAAFRSVDVVSLDEVQALMDATVGEFGRLDVLFNNAGIGGYGPLPDLEPDQWHRIIDVDLNSVYYGCKAVIPHLRNQGGGVIVNTASISGLFGDYGLPAYTAAKAGVANLTRTLAIDLARDNIRVNAVCPGPVETAMTKNLAADEEIMEEYRKLIPMARMGQPQEIAAAVAFLASDDASYLTGHNLVVDGGVTAGTGQPNFDILFRERGWLPGQGVRARAPRD